MWDYVRKPLNDNTGATAIEYGILIALIGMTMLFGLGKFVNSLNLLYNVINTNVENGKK